MRSYLMYMFNLAVICLCAIQTETEATNSSIVTMRLPEDTEPGGGFEKIIYSILGEDKAVLNEYLKIISEVFTSGMFKEHLKFVHDIRMKCLPKLYLRLRRIKPSDFANCQTLHSNLIDAFGNKILDACKKADSFLNCLTNARKSLTEKYGEIEEDIVELYLNEIIGGRNTCMGDILRQLKIFSDLVQKECK